MAKRKKSSPANKRVTRPASRMVVVEYEITSEPIIEGVYKSIPESIRDRLSELYTIIQEHPEEAIPELETLLQQYPQVPNIYNYLSTAYLMAGEEEKAK